MHHENRELHVVISFLRLLVLLGQFREVVFGNRIEQDTAQSNCRPNSVILSNWILENDNTGDNDYDPLDGVSDSMRDGMNTIQRFKCDLLVEIKEQTRDKQGEQQLGRGHNSCYACGSCFPCFPDFHRMVNDQCEGREQDCRHDGKHAKQVCSAHILTLGLVQAELGKYVPSGECKVGRHSGQKAEPGEGNLGHTSHDNSTNDRHQGKVNREGENALQEDAAADDIDKGLHTFDDVRERYSDSAEGDNGTDVAHNMANADREHGLEGFLRNDGLLPKTKSPDWEDVENTDKKLGPRNEPGDWEPVEDFLVGNVVHNVESIPEEDVQAH